MLAPPGHCLMFEGAKVFRVYVAAVRVVQRLPEGKLCVVRTRSGMWGVVPHSWLRRP